MDNDQIAIHNDDGVSASSEASKQELAPRSERFFAAVFDGIGGAALFILPPVFILYTLAAVITETWSFRISEILCKIQNYDMHGDWKPFRSTPCKDIDGFLILEKILMVFLILGIIIGTLWLIWSFVTWQRATTPGHSLFHHVIIHRSTGKGFSWGRMLLREIVIKGILGAILNGITAIYGVANALFIFRDDRRTIHDHIADSVVYKRVS